MPKSIFDAIAEFVGDVEEWDDQLSPRQHILQRVAPQRTDRPLFGGHNWSESLDKAVYDVGDEWGKAFARIEAMSEERFLELCQLWRHRDEEIYYRALREAGYEDED